MGVFKEVERQLETVPKEKQQQAFEHITKAFGVELRLQKLKQTTDHSGKQQRLAQGELVLLEGDGMVVGYQLKNSGLVMTVAAGKTSA